MISTYRVFITILISTLILFGCNGVETRDARYNNTSRYYDDFDVRDPEQKYTSRFNDIKKTPRHEYLSQSSSKK